MTIDTKKLALRITSVAASKKALKRVILDMRGISDLCDYFVIVSGNSNRQVNAIAQAIVSDLDIDGIKPLSKGVANDESGWVVLDFGSVIAHMFYKPMREFYSLERLWSEAKMVRPQRKRKSA
ncbi:MAG: ribosome silencing factor [Candidatus Omnitrophota bacterium]|nr:ribosome silencing factor [Candidatus Omnitrophota bacterium]